jgi:hypothetical protein
MHLIKINVLNYAYSFIKNAQIIDTSHNFCLCLELFVVCANSGVCVCVCACARAIQRRRIKVTCNSSQKRLNKVMTKSDNLNRSQLDTCQEEFEDSSKGKIGSFFTDGVTTPGFPCATRVRLHSSDNDVKDAVIIFSAVCTVHIPDVTVVAHQLQAVVCEILPSGM